MDGQTQQEIRQFVLQNALRYKGKADPKAITGKIMGLHQSLRNDPAAAMEAIQQIVMSVNAMSVDEQRAELTKNAPQLLEKKAEKRKGIFDVLGIKEGEEVRTAFPPGPEKYPHIGHAKASLFNYLIAKKHGGSFILRFEDTNPKLVKEEFYGIIQENLKWLGIEWDEMIYASDHMETFYSYARQLIDSGDAYVCVCPQETIRKSRLNAAPCSCRTNTPKKNLELWVNLPKQEEGSGILRLRIDLEHKNSTMRDPTIFRVIKTPHARLKDTYSVWPNYDFQNAIMDGISRITHRVRSKEFEMRSELQRHIQDLLSLPPTKTYEFARFNIVGVESSGRVIREMVESGMLIGWDDPQLTTLVSLRRRGFVPEAIQEFLLKTGMTKSEATLTWDDLIMHNRRILDAKVNRMFFVPDPVSIQMKGAKTARVILKNHPEFPDRGTREITLGTEIFLARDDVSKIEGGKLYRLMDAYNFTFEAAEYRFRDDDLDSYRATGSGIFHYLPADADLDDVEVMMPDHSIIKGKCEKMGHLDQGDIVQFERFGFVRLDDKDKKRFWYTHK